MRLRTRVRQAWHRVFPDRGERLWRALPREERAGRLASAQAFLLDRAADHADFLERVTVAINAGSLSPEACDRCGGPGYPTPGPDSKALVATYPAAWRCLKCRGLA